MNHSPVMGIPSKDLGFGQHLHPLQLQQSLRTCVKKEEAAWNNYMAAKNEVEVTKASVKTCAPGNPLMDAARAVGVLSAMNGLMQPYADWKVASGHVKEVVDMITLLDKKQKTTK